VGQASGESFRVRRVSRGEHGRPHRDALLGQAVMDVGRRQQAEAGMMVFHVVPREEDVAVGPGILDRGEPLGECRAVLERLEVRLREWVVVGDVRSGMGLGCPPNCKPIALVCSVSTTNPSARVQAVVPQSGQRSPGSFALTASAIFRFWSSEKCHGPTAFLYSPDGAPSRQILPVEQPTNVRAGSSSSGPDEPIPDLRAYPQTSSAVRASTFAQSTISLMRM
jgi:hypothetical protein